MKYSSVFRCCLSAALVPLILASGASVRGDETADNSRRLTTQDGWQIQISYFPSTRGKESPCIMLVPGCEGYEKSHTRKAWEELAKFLQKNNYAVVTVDLRKHGDSVPLGPDGKPLPQALRLLPADYQLMALQDLEAVKDFLVEEHQKEKLNIRKLGIVSAGSSCLVVSAFTVADWAKKPWPDAATLAERTPKGQDVRAILMLSPEASVKGLNTAAVVRGVGDPSKGIGVHILFNPSDRREAADAEKMFKYLKLRSDPEKAREKTEGLPDSKYTAEGMLTGRSKELVEKYAKDFLDKFVKQREDPWKTRTSRLE